MDLEYRSILKKAPVIAVVVVDDDEAFRLSPDISVLCKAFPMYSFSSPFPREFDASFQVSTIFFSSYLPLEVEQWKA